MTESEGANSSRLTELRDEAAYLNRAVESAKKWQTRSWAKRAFHHWSPPARTHSKPVIPEASPTDISGIEADLLEEIRYLSHVIESAEKWQKRSRAKKAFHKWRIPKRPPLEPRTAEALPHRHPSVETSFLHFKRTVANSLKRSAWHLSGGRSFAPFQEKFLATSYDHLDTFLRSSRFAESLEKVRALDTSIPVLESWSNCPSIIPPLGLAQYQLFGEIRSRLASRLEIARQHPILCIEKNEELLKSIIQSLSSCDQSVEIFDIADLLSHADPDSAIRGLSNALFSLTPQNVITNPQSFCWDVYVRFGKQLSRFMRLHMAFDERDLDIDIELFSRIFPCLTSLLCSTEPVREKLVKRFNVPTEQREKLLVIQGDIKYIFAHKENQTNLEQSQPGQSVSVKNQEQSFDISAILNLHREGLLCGPTLANFKEAIENAKSNGLRVETIVVCDRSDALTLSMVHAYQDAGFRVIQTNLGDPALARNAGISEAIGKFVCFLDGDDFWSENWLVACHRYLSATAEFCVLHPALNLYFGATQGIMPHPDSLHPAFDVDGLRLENLWTCPCFAAKEIFLDYPYRASDLKLGFGHEDWHWNSSTLADGIAHRPCPNTFHIIRQKRQSRSNECDAVDARVWPSPLTPFLLKDNSKRGVKISLLHATRNRALKALQTRDLWIEKAKYPQLIEHIFAYDDDDLESRAAFQHVHHVEIQDGGTCIKAWNMAADLSTGEILLQLSDDWIPSDFWDEAILSRLDVTKSQVLAISDGHRKDQLLCMAILTRKRFIDQKYLFHPEFESVYSDDWFTFAAYQDGVVVSAKDIIFTHDHPYHKGTEEDETYKHNNQPARYQRGEATFNRLKKETYGLPMENTIEASPHPANLPTA